MCLVARDIVAGGFLLGSGYCRRNRWRLPECILPLGECVFGPALIFGGTGPWRALWASALLLRVVPGREKMVEGKKRRGGALKNIYDEGGASKKSVDNLCCAFSSVTPIGKKSGKTIGQSTTFEILVTFF